MKRTVFRVTPSRSRPMGLVLLGALIVLPGCGGGGGPDGAVAPAPAPAFSPAPAPASVPAPGPASAPAPSPAAAPAPPPAAGPVPASAPGPAPAPAPAPAPTTGDTTPPSASVELESAVVSLPGVKAVFRITWSEPVTGFGPEDVSSDVGARGGFTQVGPTSWRQEVDLSWDALTPTFTVSGAAVRDLAGNTSAGPFGLTVGSSSTDADYGAASPGDGGGGAGGGGSAGDAGNPGYVPDVFAVTASRAGGDLRLSWSRHPASSPVVFYQVIVNTGTPTRAGAVLSRFGSAIAAVHASYSVKVPVPATVGQRVFYRIRACNTQPPFDDRPDSFNVNGFTGCRDSEEFIAGELIAGGQATGTRTTFCPRVLAQNGDYGPDVLVPYGLTPSECGNS